MSELTSEQKEYYLDIGNKHCNFLVEHVWKPAFMMAFIHGVKHGRKDAIRELKLCETCKGTGDSKASVVDDLSGGIVDTDMPCPDCLKGKCSKGKNE